MTDAVLSGLPAPVPSPDGLDAPFWAGTRLHRLMVQLCGACGTVRAPEWICHRCHSFDIAWEQTPPVGTVFSWERVWHSAAPGLEESLPYVVVVIELEGANGLRLLGNLVGDPLQSVGIGDRVEAVFEDHESYTLVQWRVLRTPIGP